MGFPGGKPACHAPRSLPCLMPSLLKQYDGFFLYVLPLRLNSAGKLPFLL